MTWKHYSLEQAAARFDNSEDFTIGIEEEFQILDPDTLALVDRFEELQALVHRQIDGFVRGELMASEIEICTDKCYTMAQAEADLKAKRRHLFESAAELGVLLAVSGTHPFADWKDQRIIDTPHYRLVEEELRYCAWRNVTYGLHVHVGIRGRDRAIAVFNALRGYLPTLLALSANSPFAEGSYTYLHSARTQIFTKFFPRCNVPGTFQDWKHYANFVDTLFATNSIAEPTQIWWSVRPHTTFGTLEIRICDGQSNVDDALAIAGLTVALVAKLARQYDLEGFLRYLSNDQIEENLWRALRYGLDGKLIDFSRRREVTAADAVLDLAKYTAEVHEPLGLGKYIGRLGHILNEGNGAQRQIRQFEQSQDLMAVFADVVARSQLMHPALEEQASG